MKIFSILFLFIPIFNYAQSSETEIRCIYICEFPDAEASFSGGSMEMMKYIQVNIEYPENFEADRSSCCKTTLEFLVDVEGNLSEIRVLKPVSKGGDQIWLNLISNMPRWIPAVKDGRNVCTYVRLPVSIHLD